MKRLMLEPLVCVLAALGLAASGLAFAQKRPLRVGMTLSGHSKA